MIERLLRKKSYKEEEQYIIEESPEISIGAFPYIIKIFDLFPALSNKNYQLYILGQLVSLSGTWLQVVAQGWLVLQLTDSAFYLGLIAGFATLPTLLFALWGGVIVDRFPKKHIIIFTQACAMTLAFALGILTILDIITVWQIALLAFLLGTVAAIDAPARQSFVPEIVSKDQLQSAIALNSGVFNASRVIGPSFAGVLIVVVGVGGAFIVNGLSYIAVITALMLMKVQLYVPKKHLHPIAAIKEGLHFSFGHPIIRLLLIFVGIVSVFGWSYATMLPVIAKNTFGLGASGLGYLYAASGLGSLVAVFLVSGLSKKIKPMFFIIGGNTLFAISLVLFTFTSHLGFALLSLCFSSLGLLALFTRLNATIQSIVTNEVRGRVMSIYVLMFAGLAPLGNFQIGILSERYGPAIAIRIGAIIVFLFGLLVFATRKRIHEAHLRYQQGI